MASRDEWTLRARRAGRAARKKYRRLSARGQFEKWWSAFYDPEAARWRMPIRHAFIRGYLEREFERRDGEPPPVITRAQRFEQITASLEAYVAANFREDGVARDEWLRWAKAARLDVEDAKKMKGAFLRAWQGRADDEQDARECAEREADRAARAAAFKAGERI